MNQIFLRKEGSHLHFRQQRRTKGFTNGSDFSFVVYFLCLMPATAVFFICHLAIYHISNKHFGS